MNLCVHVSWHTYSLIWLSIRGITEWFNVRHFLPPVRQSAPCSQSLSSHFTRSTRWKPRELPYSPITPSASAKPFVKRKWQQAKWHANKYLTVQMHRPVHLQWHAYPQTQTQMHTYRTYPLTQSHCRKATNVYWASTKHWSYIWMHKYYNWLIAVFTLPIICSTRKDNTFLKNIDKFIQNKAPPLDNDS